MPTKPERFKPTWLGQGRKPYENSRTARQRITGRKLQERNKRIKERDRYICQCCGRVTEDGEVDHRIPLSQGGTEDDANLQWLCRTPCHEDKSRREKAGGIR